MKPALLALALLITVPGCSEPVNSGYVVSKSYDDPDTWTVLRPIYSQHCTPRTRTYTTTSNGRTTTRTSVEQSCISRITGHYPVVMHDGAHWSLRVRDDADPDRVGNVSVSEHEYDRYAVGDHWPEAR